METRLFIGSGFNFIFSKYIEIIRLESRLIESIDLESDLTIQLDSEITKELELSSLVYG